MSVSLRDSFSNLFKGSGEVRQLNEKELLELTFSPPATNKRIPFFVLHGDLRQPTERQGHHPPPSEPHKRRNDYQQLDINPLSIQLLFTMVGDGTRIFFFTKEIEAFLLVVVFPTWSMRISWFLWIVVSVIDLFCSLSKLEKAMLAAVILIFDAATWHSCSQGSKKWIRIVVSPS